MNIEIAVRIIKPYIFIISSFLLALHVPLFSWVEITAYVIPLASHQAGELRVGGVPFTTTDDPPLQILTDAETRFGTVVQWKYPSIQQTYHLLLNIGRVTFLAYLSLWFVFFVVHSKRLSGYLKERLPGALFSFRFIGSIILVCIGEFRLFLFVGPLVDNSFFKKVNIVIAEVHPFWINWVIMLISFGFSIIAISIFSRKKQT